MIMIEDEKDPKVIKLPPKKYDYSAWASMNAWKSIRPENRKGKKNDDDEREAYHKIPSRY